MAERNRRRRVIVGRVLLIAVAIAALYGLAGGVKGIAGWRRLSRDVSELERQVRQAQVTIDSLEREIVRLRSDTAFIERVARERLGMIRPGEKVYKFVEGR